MSADSNALEAPSLYVHFRLHFLKIVEQTILISLPHKSSHLCTSRTQVTVLITMTAFSAAALAAQCQTIHHRTISAAVSVAETAAQWHASDSPLIQLSTKFRELGEAACELGVKLSAIELVSQTLQNAIIDRIKKCVFAEGIVEKGSGVSETRQLPIDRDLLSKYESWMSLETSVMQGLVEAMQM